MGAVIYSAIYGGYDDPKPLPEGLDASAVMLTDSDETAAHASHLGWLSFVVPHAVTTTNGDPAKLAPMLAHKWWKTHPQALNNLSVEHARGARAMLSAVGPDSLGPHEVALWVDGSITITRPDYSAACLQALGRDDAAFTPHPWRDCAIAEGEYSATLARYADTPVGRQTQFYAEFHPRGWGLFASGAIAWRVNPATAIFGELWWLECLLWSHQDQVSLPILLRLARERALPQLPGTMRWNNNLPWEQWWTLAHHKIAP